MLVSLELITMISFVTDYDYYFRNSKLHFTSSVLTSLRMVLKVIIMGCVEKISPILITQVIITKASRFFYRKISINQEN